MCKAPKPPKEKAPLKPEFLRNRYLDAAVGSTGVVGAIRTGRSGLRIPLGDATTGATGALNTGGLGRQPGEELTRADAPALDLTPQPQPTLRDRKRDALTTKFGLRPRA